MSYFPSSQPLPFNSQSPNVNRLLRQAARNQRAGQIMARGRLSNQQCQIDRPRGLGDLSASQMQELADAPQMVLGSALEAECAPGDDRPLPCSSPVSAPPWANAQLTGPACAAPVFPPADFSLGQWVCDHPWIALAIAAGVGVAVKAVTEK